MKKTLIALTAVLSLGVPGVAVADEATDVLLNQIDDLNRRVHGLTTKVEHKNDVLACERANRRRLERALRHGGPVLVKRCR